MFTKIENLLVPIILVVVACFQLYNSQFGCLDPWKGAGFGMFSTNEKSKINAIGYLENGDSILITVMGNKYNVPISANLVKTAHRYPKDETLRHIGRQMLQSYYRPDTLRINPEQVDEASYAKIQDNPQFYQRIYKPIFYQNQDKIEKDKSVRISRVKLIVYKSNFYDEDWSVRKEYLKEVTI